MTRLGRAAHQRLLAGDFMGLTFLGLDAVPNDGDEPAYDLTLRSVFSRTLSLARTGPVFQG
jgi:hypothetical protein